MQQAQLVKNKKAIFISKEDLNKLTPASLQELPRIPPDLFHEGKTLYARDFIFPQNILSRENELVLYHGTNMTSTLSMLQDGIHVLKSHGVLGTGFYVSPSATEALRWARRGKPRVVIALAVKRGDEATVGCVPRNSQFQRKCDKTCTLYTAYDTVMVRRPGGFHPFFWQYLIKDQSLFDSGRIYIKQIYIVLDSSRRTQTGGAASASPPRATKKTPQATL